MFEELFRQRYLESLSFYKHFYDDIAEYGNPGNPRRVFYFIPGINGVPGQARFIFPSLHARYGADFYLRCCHLPAFSAGRPIWEKYTTANIDRRRAVIVDDLKRLLGTYGEVVVMASSNGFYDLVHAWDALREIAAGGGLKLLWGACAPDRFEPSAWEPLLFRLNGFVHDGHRWFAYPNHNLLRLFNPETTTSHRWRLGRQKKTFYKIDLESRFVCFNLYWDYVSTSCFNAMLEHMLRGAAGPLDIEAHVLVAANDGFWQGKGRAAVTAVIDKYLSNSTVTFKDASHLWVAAPEHATALLDRLEGRSGR